MIRNDVDQTPQYVNYILNFKEDGTVVTGFRGDAQSLWWNTPSSFLSHIHVLDKKEVKGFNCLMTF